MSASRMAEPLRRNAAFAQAGAHRGATIMPALGLFVITCLDPRVDPAAVLGLRLGDAAVVRNAGGRVTDEVLSDVAFIGALAERAVPDGPLFEVAVLHHTQCGTAALSDAGFRADYAARAGLDEALLAGRAVLDPAATAAADVARLRAAPAISPRIRVTGHVYDVVTGSVRSLDAG